MKRILYNTRSLCFFFKVFKTNVFQFWCFFKKSKFGLLVKIKGGRFQRTNLLWLLFEGSKVHFCIKLNSVELSWGCIEVELELWKNLITRQKFRGRRDQTMFYQSQNLSKLKEDLCFSLCSWSLHEHARETLMSTCAHERFMSMLMKPSRARAREAVTGKTTL